LFSVTPLTQKGGASAWAASKIGAAKRRPRFPWHAAGKTGRIASSLIIAHAAALLEPLLFLPAIAVVFRAIASARRQRNDARPTHPTTHPTENS
jgi:hypothetical protein